MSEVKSKTYESRRGKDRTLMRRIKQGDGYTLSPIEFRDGVYRTSIPDEQKYIEGLNDYGKGIVLKGQETKLHKVLTPIQQKEAKNLVMKKAEEMYDFETDQKTGKIKLIPKSNSNNQAAKTTKDEPQKSDGSEGGAGGEGNEKTFPGIDKVQPAQDKLIELGVVESVAEVRSRKAVHEVADKAGVSFPDLSRE